MYNLTLSVLCRQGFLTSQLGLWRRRSSPKSQTLVKREAKTRYVGDCRRLYRDCHHPSPTISSLPKFVKPRSTPLPCLLSLRHLPGGRRQPSGSGPVVRVVNSSVGYCNSNPTSWPKDLDFGLYIGVTTPRGVPVRPVPRSRFDLTCRVPSSLGCLHPSSRVVDVCPSPVNLDLKEKDLVPEPFLRIGGTQSRRSRHFTRVVMGEGTIQFHVCVSCLPLVMISYVVTSRRVV